MNKHAGTLRNESRAWIEVPADDNGDAMIAAMAEAGVEYIFFTSGSEIGFYQEAVAKAHAQGRKAPKLITVTHEHASLNAALGYAAVSGKPAVTAAHVDCGTQHYGGAVHTAFHSGLPVVITGGGSPTSYPGSFPGARDGGGHIWLQQSFDQNGIVRQYTKWDHRMELQDNAGLMISRALQVARTEPCGPVYLTLPREVSLHKIKGAKFPTMEQLGVARPAAPDAEGITRDRAAAGQGRKSVRAGGALGPQSGDGAGAGAALRIDGAAGRAIGAARLPVLPAQPSALHERREPEGRRRGPRARRRHSLARRHQSAAGQRLGRDDRRRAGQAPHPDDGVHRRPAAHRRRAVGDRGAGGRGARADHAGGSAALQRPRRRNAPRPRAKRRTDLAEDAKSRASKTPIDPKWLSYRIAKVLDDNCIVFDETIAQNQLHDYLNISQPGAYFHNPASSGGWATGAAFGAKLAAPEKDVIAVSGDGFYMFGTPIHALWAARHYKAPFMAVVYQNRSYSTGTLRINCVYGRRTATPPRPITTAAISIRRSTSPRRPRPPAPMARTSPTPAQIEGALRRGLKAIREEGRPAVISVWLARLLQKD